MCYKRCGSVFFYYKKKIDTKHKCLFTRQNFKIMKLNLSSQLDILQCNLPPVVLGGLMSNLRYFHLF